MQALVFGIEKLMNINSSIITGKKQPTHGPVQ